jgi:hypothetical protein
MRLRGYQVGELLGIALILASTAAQLFFLEPLKREIEWRLAAFSIQQTGQLQTKAAYDSRIAILQALKAPQEQIEAAATERDAALKHYKTADANVSDFVIEKERVEEFMQLFVIGLFVFGTLLTGLGRAMEMRANKTLE